MLPIILLAAALATPPSDADVANGLENLRRVLIIGQAIDSAQEMRTPLFFQQAPVDPWGTPYCISKESGSVIGAGSDQTFEPVSARSEQFEGVTGDIVFSDGKMFRSNRNWLAGFVRSDAASGAALRQLQQAEASFMVARTEEMRDVRAIRETLQTIEGLSAILASYRTKHASMSALAAASHPALQLVTEMHATPLLLLDGWGTPLKLLIEGRDYTIVSAGGDRHFNSASWTTPASGDPAEDIVFRDGEFLRRPDEGSLLLVASDSIAPVPQPPDPKPASRDEARWRQLGGEVKAPVIVERTKTDYPEVYRKLHLSGIVIVECEISETGTVGNVRVLKSLAPDFDIAATESVRQWKFRAATAGGQPVPVLDVITVQFRLE